MFGDGSPVEGLICATNPDSYQTLKSKLAETDEKTGLPTIIFINLAIADRVFGTVVEQLGHWGLGKEDKQDWRRVVVEKPFGHDVASAKAERANSQRGR